MEHLQWEGNTKMNKQNKFHTSLPYFSPSYRLSQIQVSWEGAFLKYRARNTFAYFSPSTLPRIFQLNTNKRTLNYLFTRFAFDAAFKRTSVQLSYQSLWFIALGIAKLNKTCWISLKSCDCIKELQCRLLTGCREIFRFKTCPAFSIF